MTTRSFERRHSYLRRLVDKRLASLVKGSEPRDLVEGSRYVLRTEGKRIRSTLVILSCEAVGGRVRDALDAAVALEMLHNFTLVHDDVMDHAPSRRGRATVHTQWGVNNAILIGDVILGLAYRALLRSKTGDTRRIVQLFTDGFIGVCEGQAFDIEYERDSVISMREYYRMIGKKTGELFVTATQVGAVLGNGTRRQSKALRVFGQHIGKAFQIQDDLLDVVADAKHLGKRIGGDIIERKKTFLLVEALQRTRGAENSHLRRLTTQRHKPIRGNDQRSLVEEVAAIYEHCGAVEAALTRIRAETEAGVRALQDLPRSNARAMLQWISAMLVQRSH